MKENNYKNIFLGRRRVGVVICALLVATSMTAMTATSDLKDIVKQPFNLNKKMIDSDTLSYTFKFSEPSFESTEIDDSEYTLVHMPGCMALGKQAGEPKLPVRFIKLLIPAKKSVKNIDVIGTPIELGNIDLVEKPVVPYQYPVPIGSQPEDFDFVINSGLYSSNALYPSKIYENYNIDYCRGYAILDMPLKPIQYIPSQGKIMYYPEITVNIELGDTEYVNQFYRNNPEDKAWVEKLVWNPEITETYTAAGIPTFEYEGGLCDPDDDYDYVIITTEDNGLDYWETSDDIPYNWDSLMDKHASDDGYSCTLVTEQEIDECEDYENDPPFNDIQAHIREFCKDAYEDWGTQYVLIGGDGEYIPARLMSYQYEYNVEADIYWSNLDKNFNKDEDSYWGEEGDLGFDLYAELFIGRLTCDTPQDVSNWMTKSFYYADSIEDTYLDNAAFYGGNTGWQCEGDDFIDYSAIKGTDDWLGPNPGAHGPYPEWLGFQFGFETWNENNPDNQYDLSVAWTAEPPNPGWQGGYESAAIEGLKTAINEDRVALISGIAHANSDMSLDVSSSSWESNYHNTKPFFIHDYGCHCGDFYPTDDGVLHSMLFHSDTELAFACVYHTSYGWGSLQDTNSSSALQMKLFWDYMFDMENNSKNFNNWQLGKAMAWSKDAMAPTINWTYPDAPGSWRGTIQACLLFGDPAQKIKTPHPSEPPETPDAPEGPDKWIIDVECTFTAATIDPEGENIYYLFDWGDGNNSGWIGPYPSGQTAEASHTWTKLGDYEVKVRARDIWGVASNWSLAAPLSIVEDEAPYTPEITGKQLILGGMKHDYTFVADDPEEHDIYYHVDWDDGHETDWLGPYSSGESITLSHAWYKKGKFWVKAWAKDAFEKKSSQGHLIVTVIFVIKPDAHPSNNPNIQILNNILQNMQYKTVDS